MVCILSNGYHDTDGMQSKKKEILMKVCYDNGKDRSEFMKKAFQVEGMMCQHCEQRVNKALQGMEGVRACSASAKDGIVNVEYDAQRINDAAVAYGFVMEFFFMSPLMVERYTL